tara:strand:+ start:169 stop:465 length:297 start_codon:yes stop_codon:yes gene_type:complete
MKKDNISDDDLEILTDKVLQKLIERSSNPRWHQMNSPMTIAELIQGQLPFQESTEEMLVAELARLTTLLNMYEHNEEYMKAAIIKRKLEIIQDKLNKL